MRYVILGLATLLSANSAFAGCYGSDAFETCYDSNSGNRYSIQRFGDTTTMQGSNAETGSTWRQNSTTIGDMTIHRGTDSDGNSWRTTCFNGRCR